MRGLDALFATEQNGRDEYSRLVDLIGIGKSRRKGGTALEEETGDAAAAEVDERGLDVVGDQNLSTGVAQCRGVSFGRDHDEHRRLVESSEQLRIDGQASPAVEDNPNWLPTGLKRPYMSRLRPVGGAGG